MPILVFVQVAIMTLYVKGFKIDRQKVANIVGASNINDPLVDAGINAVVKRINRSAYLKIEGGWDRVSPDAKREIEFILAFAIGTDKDELKAKDLGELDETIMEALPYVLVGPDVWELYE
jgi:hypothetical protein